MAAKATRRKTRPTGPLPASVPRDLILYRLRREERALHGALVGQRTRYIARRKVIQVTLEFDPAEYLRRTR